MIASTSRAAYRSLDLQQSEAELMALVHQHFPRSKFTRKELSRATRWEINRIAGRVNSLISKGELTEYLNEIRDGGHLLSIAPSYSKEKGHGSGPVSASHNSGRGAVTPAAGPAEPKASAPEIPLAAPPSAELPVATTPAQPKGESNDLGNSGPTRNRASDLRPSRADLGAQHAVPGTGDSLHVLDMARNAAGRRDIQFARERQVIHHDGQWWEVDMDGYETWHHKDGSESRIRAVRLIRPVEGA